MYPDQVVPRWSIVVWIYVVLAVNSNLLSKKNEVDTILLPIPKLKSQLPFFNEAQLLFKDIV